MDALNCQRFYDAIRGLIFAALIAIYHGIAFFVAVPPKATHLFLQITHKCLKRCWCLGYLKRCFICLQRRCTMRKQPALLEATAMMLKKLCFYVESRLPEITESVLVSYLFNIMKLFQTRKQFRSKLDEDSETHNSYHRTAPSAGENAEISRQKSFLRHNDEYVLEVRSFPNPWCRGDHVELWDKKFVIPEISTKKRTAKSSPISRQKALPPTARSIHGEKSGRKPWCSGDKPHPSRREFKFLTPQEIATRRKAAEKSSSRKTNDPGKSLGRNALKPDLISELFIPKHSLKCRKNCSLCFLSLPEVDAVMKEIMGRSRTVGEYLAEEFSNNQELLVYPVGVIPAVQSPPSHPGVLPQENPQRTSPKQAKVPTSVTDSSVKSPSKRAGTMDSIREEDHELFPELSRITRTGLRPLEDELFDDQTSPPDQIFDGAQGTSANSGISTFRMHEQNEVLRGKMQQDECPQSIPVELEEVGDASIVDGAKKTREHTDD